MADQALIHNVRLPTLTSYPCPPTLTQIEPDASLLDRRIPNSGGAVLCSFPSTPEVRALPSTGITRLRRYLCPSPTPRWSAVLADAVRRSRPRDHPGPPLLTQTTFLACCAHYPGGPIRAAGYRYDALPRRVLPDRLSLPRFSAGSAPHWAFRGLLELYTRYGLPSRSPTFLWTLSRGSDPASFPTEPLASYRI